ncbi:MAG: PqqD family protein [Lachnotalea sp.]
MLTNKSIRHVYWEVSDNTEFNNIYAAILDLSNISSLTIDISLVTSPKVISILTQLIKIRMSNLSVVASISQWQKYSHDLTEYFDVITLKIEETFQINDSLITEIRYLYDLDKYVDAYVMINKKNYSDLDNILSSINLCKIDDATLAIDTIGPHKLDSVSFFDFITKFSRIRKNHRNIHIENNKKLLNSIIVNSSFNRLFISESGGIGIYYFLPTYETVFENTVGPQWERYVKYFFYQDARFYIAGYGMKDAAFAANEIKEAAFNFGPYHQQVPKRSLLWKLRDNRLVSKRTGETFKINKTGMTILAEINGQISTLDIIRNVLADRFLIDGTTTVKLLEYIEQLESKGIIKIGT